jgi:hypothetical protein
VPATARSDIIPRATAKGCVADPDPGFSIVCLIIACDPVVFADFISIGTITRWRIGLLPRIVCRVTSGTGRDRLIWPPPSIQTLFATKIHQVLPETLPCHGSGP